MPVNTKSKQFKDLEDDLELVSALWGGTRAMRDAGKTYLPQEPGEENEDYKVRKNRSTLTNIFRKTINTYAGRIFSEPVTIEGQERLDDFEENVDLEGRDFHRFGYDLARFTLRDGLRFIVIEAPIADGVETKADDRIAGIRPYFIDVDARNVLGLKVDTSGSQTVITQFRMIETVHEGGDEFVQDAIDQIRVIEPNQVSLYRKNAKGDWHLYDTIITSVGFVAVVPVFSDRQGFMESQPPLMDLAWLNIEHWQKSSDQSNILHVARVPILHWSGYKPMIDADGNSVDLTVSANTMAKSADPQAKLTYVSIESGSGIDAGRQDLIDIENRMVALGAEFVTPNKSGDMTATEKAIDESGDISELSAFAQNLKDSLTVAMGMVADMLGTTFTGEINLNTDLGIMTTPVNMEEVIKMRAMGDISREGMYEIANDEWGTNLDLEQEEERLSTEPLSLSADIGE